MTPGVSTFLSDMPPPPVPLVQHSEHPEGSAPRSVHTTGPRGGDVNNPKTYPERRRAEFRATEGVDGTLPLHRHNPTDLVDKAHPGLKNEQVWHRMAAFMLINGRTNSEIAQAAGVTTAAVTTLRSQLWFQQLLATIENESGQAYTALLHGEAIASLEKVVALRDNSDSERIVLTASQWIAEQAHGKAVQKVISTVTHHAGKTPQDELAELDAQLEALHASQKQAKPAVSLGATHDADRLVGNTNSVVSISEIVE